MQTSAPFVIHAMEVGPMENIVYLIEDRATARVAVVDPAWDAPAIEARAAQLGLQISDVLLTHSHYDHVNALQAVLRTHDAQIHLLKKEMKFWGQALPHPTLHHGGDRIELGATQIQVLHTPGHTPGSACYALPGHLLAGDTVFVFGCGRCDLAGGDPEVMYDTLRDLKTQLAPDTIIHPGHNYAVTPTSTWQEQIDGNPFLHFNDRAAFVRYRMDYHDRHRHGPYGPLAPGEAMPSA